MRNTLLSADDHNLPDSANVLEVSVDGYIRMSFTRLRQLPLVHLISGLDEQEPEQFLGATSTCITGYTDWVSDTFPTVTVGWDWQMECCCGRIVFNRLNEPRSNILLLDSMGRDIAETKNNAVLETYLDSLPWSDTVERYIRQRYEVQ